MELERDETSHQHPKRRKPTNPSILKIPNLPADLITEILSRLPVKSLLRFRCVSKSWLALISSPEFVKIHLNISANNKDYAHHRLILCCFLSSNPREGFLEICSLTSLLSESVTHSFDLDYPMKNTHKHDAIKSVDVVGCVNGLICIAIEKKYFFLWNPPIRKFKKFPDPSGTLASDCHYVHGFGYDELNDDYKVLLITAHTRTYNNSHQVKICSMKGDSLTRVHDVEIGQLLGQGMCLNGKLYWANNSSRDDLMRYNDWDIISIDLADGELEKIEKPCYGEGDTRLMPCVGVLGSDLSVVCSDRRTLVDVWIMKDSWIKMYSINPPNDDPGGHLFGSPFFISNNGEILLEIGFAFMIYNPKDGSIRRREVSNFNAFWDSVVYIENLVWPFPEGTKEG